LGNEECVKLVAILKLADLEHIGRTCRNKIGSNINLNLSSAVERLKINWKQLIWMVRHGLKHKYPHGSNTKGHKTSIAGWKRNLLAITDKRSNHQVGKQNPRTICKYINRE
jgi:hypothetical protein